MNSVWVISKWHISCCPCSTIIGGYTTQDKAERVVQQYAYWEQDLGLSGEWVSTQEANVWYNIDEIRIFE